MSADFECDYRSFSLQRPALTYLSKTEMFLIVESQLKCCSVANDAAPDWSGLEQHVVDEAINE